MTRHERVLSFAVGSGACALIVMQHGELVHAERLRDSASHPSKGRSAFRLALSRFEPDLVVFEDPDRNCRKQGVSLRLLRTLAQAVGDESVRGIRLVRVQRYVNQFEEAAALAEEFPEFREWLPSKWAIYERAPRKLLYFEALSFIVEEKAARSR